MAEQSPRPTFYKVPPTKSRAERVGPTAKSLSKPMVPTMVGSDIHSTPVLLPIVDVAPGTFQRWYVRPGKTPWVSVVGAESSLLPCVSALSLYILQPR